MANDVLGHGVAAQAAVAEQERALGRDDVRRVRDDEVELLAVDGLEEAAEPRLDVADAVERDVELRVSESSRVHVRRDDVFGVRREEDRLDAVAGAEVERTLAGSAHRHVRERDRRPVHARDVVGVAVRRRVIGRDQQLVVRNDARGSANGLAVVDEQTGAGKAVAKLRVDELVEPLARDGHAEQEEPDEQRELVGVAEPSQVRGQLRRPGEEVVAGRKPLLDSLRVVSRVSEQPRELDAVLQGIRARGSRSRRASPPSAP